MPLYGLHDFICLYMATSLASIKHHAVQILTQTSLSAHKLVDPWGGGSIYIYIYMVVSQNKGSPIWTPIYYSPYYGDTQNGTPNFRKPPYLGPNVGIWEPLFWALSRDYIPAWTLWEAWWSTSVLPSGHPMLWKLKCHHAILNRTWRVRVT